jgi:hypothetical protein
VRADSGSQSLATEYSTTDQPVSLPLFLSWNLNILGDCGSLYVYQRVCKGYVSSFVWGLLT